MIAIKPSPISSIITCWLGTDLHPGQCAKFEVVQNIPTWHSSLATLKSTGGITDYIFSINKLECTNYAERKRFSYPMPPQVQDTALTQKTPQTAPNQGV